MSDGFFQRVQEVFADALERPAEARQAYLQRECAGEADVRAEVESLLAAEVEGSEYLSEPTIDTGEVSGVSDQASESAQGFDFFPETCHLTPDTSIGPYIIEGRIGVGGFGAVYRARQEQPVRRHVALKVIKLGMDTRQIVARFEQERQARHDPNPRRLR